MNPIIIKKLEEIIQLADEQNIQEYALKGIVAGVTGTAIIGRLPQLLNVMAPELENNIFIMLNSQATQN